MCDGCSESRPAFAIDHQTFSKNSEPLQKLWLFLISISDMTCRHQFRLRNIDSNSIETWNIFQAFYSVDRKSPVLYKSRYKILRLFSEVYKL